VASGPPNDIGEQLIRVQLVAVVGEKGVQRPSGTRWRHQLAASIWSSEHDVPG
jgi:hypothetical protein